ncbi:hypothetical protein E3T55_14790 [Cryobacterium frigoriphilum]|uniref:Uncharacterized protein n=1 Tax=Cryobacterium frigoriphilum TaxID=1259150 RepID=A0A4R8ZW56_9MICO|nr:hypothetical protein [Cryobacterium frigoriphilum]TFD47818.1 hypothetical protein E3T55_14790 [Cryobacterium frigoriphilum]
MTAVTASDLRGRTHITSRALTRLIRVLSAEALTVSADQVTVGLTDAAGRLAVHVRAPIGITSLSATRSWPDPHSDGTVLQRTERARQHIRLETGRLTGTDVAHVIVQVSGATINPEGRRLL